MHLTQRRAALALLLIETAAAALGLLALSLMNMDSVSQRALLVALPAFALLTFAFWRGLDWVRYVNILIALALVCGPFIDPRADRSFSPVVFVPPALAIVTAGPWWIGGSALSILLLLNLRGGGFYARPDNVIVFLLIVTCMVIGRLIADQSLRAAEANAAEAERERERAVAERANSERQSAELARQNDEQRRLIAVIRTLETPAIALAEHAVLAPLVGAFTLERLEGLAERLLRQVAEQRARLVVLDISGVPQLDPELLRSLGRTVGAIQLLGCRVTISGVSAAIATALVNGDVVFPAVPTVRSPREALALLGEQAR